MAEILTDLRDANNGPRRAAKILAGQLVSRDRVMMMLGRFMFSIGSAAPQQVRRTTRFAWPAQALVGRRPALQSLGPDDEGLELAGRIYPHYRGGTRQIDAMRALAGTGDTSLLMDGLGFIFGAFAITQIEETGTVYDAFSVARRTDFRLTLARGDDDGAAGENVLAGLF